MHIYKVTNNVNGKIYIGLSTKKPCDTYYGSGKLITSAIRKYGINSFTKEILEYCDSKDSLIEAEKRYIKMYQSNDRDIGYNVSPGGDLNPDKQRVAIYQYDTEGNLLTAFTSIEYTAKEYGNNLYRNAEIEKRPIKGFWFSKEVKTKNEIQQKHKLYLDERAKKFKDAAKKRWSNSNYAKKMRDNLDRARAAVNNYSKSIETRNKISESIRGKRWFNDGVNEKQSYECPPGWSLGRKPR